MASTDFLLRPMLERDIPATSSIFERAFSDGIISTLFPQGRTPSSRAFDAVQDRQNLRHAPWMKHNVAISRSHKPREEDLETLNAHEKQAAREEGRVVGYAIWKVYVPTPTSDSSQPTAKNTVGHSGIEESQKVLSVQTIKSLEKSRSDASGYPPDSDPLALKTFFTAINASKTQHLGPDALTGSRQYILLHFLATDPDFNRRGLGALQLAWGLQIADNLGLECYLEASEVGVALYERWGFESLGRLEFESERYGAGRRVEHICMLRSAHSHAAIGEPVNGERENGVALDGMAKRVNGMGMNEDGMGKKVNGIVTNGHAGSNGIVNGVVH